MPSTISSPLAATIAPLLPRLCELRHDLHKHPELGFGEKRTSGVIQRELTSMGIEFKAGYAKGTGVVAHIPPTDAARRGMPSIALRADMDALPIVEKTGKAYASINAGVMHACGHDGHTTILLGTARALLACEHRPNPVTLVFQPAEEGGGGGLLMCRDGALDGSAGGGVGPKVARIYGLHGWPSLPLGLIGTREGPMLAAVDDFIVDIVGVGGHAAYPQLGRDPILATAHVITALQSIASRNVAPLDAVVCTIAQLEAGTANNIIPDRVRFTGTIRTLLDSTRSLAKERFFALVQTTASAHGCVAEIQWHDSYPVTRNDAATTAEFIARARGVFGDDRVITLEHPTMGGEDFSYYGRQVPACFFFLGLKPESANQMASLHQPEFDFNDDAIAMGVEAMCAAALA